MTHKIERNDDYVGGESVTWEFTIVNENGEERDIRNADVEWYLLNSRGEPDGDAVLDHTDSGVNAGVQDGLNGLLEVEIEAGTTEDLAGNMYWQRLVVNETDNVTQIWNGPFPIQER